MTREGRLGFPRPLGNILSSYRPLIPPRFQNAPRSVAAIATSFDDMDETRSVSLRDVQGLWATDIVLDIMGVDEFSKSSLVFDPEAEFKGGMVRTGSLVMESEADRDEIGDRWNSLLTEGVGLDFQEDDIDTILREDPGFGGRATTITPHVFFTTRNPVTDHRESPLSAAEVRKATQLIAQQWPRYFADMEFAARAGMEPGG